MCSIIGWNGKFEENIVTKLCEASRIRGLHSFGYSFLNNDQIITKKFLKYDQFLNSLKASAPEKFIAHFRYSTSGDYQNEQNNQPITKEGLSMVFNGVIDMRTKEQMEEAYNVDLQTDNDGELAVIYKSRSDQEFKNLVKNKSYAGAFLDFEGNIKVFRNINRPCHIGKLNEIRILASTKDILNRAGITDTKMVGYDKFIEL